MTHSKGAMVQTCLTPRLAATHSCQESRLKQYSGCKRHVQITPTRSEGRSAACRQRKSSTQKWRTWRLWWAQCILSISTPWSKVSKAMAITTCVLAFSAPSRSASHRTSHGFSSLVSVRLQGYFWSASVVKGALCCIWPSSNENNSDHPHPPY